MRIVNEPTAAAIAYGLDAKSKEKKSGAAAWHSGIRKGFAVTGCRTLLPVVRRSE